MSKYDKIIMPVVFNGRLVGHMVQKRTVEEYAKDHWELAQFRKQFYESINGCTNTFKTPIFEVDGE